MKSHIKLLVILVASAAAIPTFAAERDLGCSLEFTAKSWSAIYMQTEGSGTVTCKDGSSMHVMIGAKGVGITPGKWAITNGSGTFTHVSRIEDVLGSYAALSVDAGAEKAGTAQMLTKGKVSLALDGTGDGFDVGVAVSDVKISRSDVKMSKKE
ncbi:hypothetical protein [Thermomonas sp.]